MDKKVKKELKKTAARLKAGWPCENKAYDELRAKLLQIKKADSERKQK